jgi:excisionase family DNA binding protein
MPTPDLLGTVEAAEAIGCERSTLSRWIDSGRITPLRKLPGRNGAVLFEREEVERVRDEYALILAGPAPSSEVQDQEQDA